MSKIFVRFLAVVLMLFTTSCIVLNIKKAGVFKDPKLYDGRYVAYIDIPSGIYGEDLKYLDREEKNGSKIGFAYLGNCGGGGMSFSGIMLPIIPIPYYQANTCEKDGFRVSHTKITNTLGVTLQLYYNGTIYDPYLDGGNVKFKIANFSEFKSASDKTLILHKRKPDGTIFTKELPFNWEIVTEVTGGL